MVTSKLEDFSRKVFIRRVLEVGVRMSRSLTRSVRINLGRKWT